MMYKFSCIVDYSNDEENILKTDVHEEKEFKSHDRAYAYMYKNYDMEYMYEVDDYWTTDWQLDEREYKHERITLKIEKQ